MMHAVDQFRLAGGPGFQAGELPYVDDSLATVVILPQAGQFEAPRATLDAGALAGIIGQLKPAQVDLRFPRFEFRTQASLKDALIELGTPIAFEGGRADFSRISPAGDSLYIQDVIHEAFISVDEDGTGAAAATAVVAGATSAPGEPVPFNVDRPFVILIRDRETGAVLFMGQVIDPTAP